MILGYSQKKIEQHNMKEAAVTHSWTAASFISTDFLENLVILTFPRIFRCGGQKICENKNFLPENHYFRLTLAKPYVPIVILVEGQIDKPLYAGVNV